MSCQHLNELTVETLIPKANYPMFRCEECIRINGHPVISSAELGEQWLWCFVDKQQKNY
jgi:hypothetical protein